MFLVISLGGVSIYFYVCLEYVSNIRVCLCVFFFKLSYMCVSECSVNQINHTWSCTTAEENCFYRISGPQSVNLSHDIRTTNRGKSQKHNSLARQIWYLWILVPKIQPSFWLFLWWVLRQNGPLNILWPWWRRRFFDPKETLVSVE